MLVIDITIDIVYRNRQGDGRNGCADTPSLTGFAFSFSRYLQKNTQNHASPLSQYNLLPTATS
jgi:hypothetical protein